MGAFVVEDGRARLRRLETGLVGEDHYEVTRGLEEGETVILRPPTDLEEGDRVTPSGSD
jgi:HlyD family secretion protein